MKLVCLVLFFFFFNDTATTEIYTLSLHDALPISLPAAERRARCAGPGRWPDGISTAAWHGGDRKSTRLNSSHLVISYAVFCLKKKKKRPRHLHRRNPTLTVDRRAEALLSYGSSHA